MKKSKMAITYGGTKIPPLIESLIKRKRESIKSATRMEWTKKKMTISPDN